MAHSVQTAALSSVLLLWMAPWLIISAIITTIFATAVLLTQTVSKYLVWYFNEWDAAGRSVSEGRFVSDDASANGIVTNNLGNLKDRIWRKHINSFTDLVKLQYKDSCAGESIIQTISPGISRTGAATMAMSSAPDSRWLGK
ncbi:hypothetical protein V1511DRAFT_511584 [Dipodascopsis uninucleata]